MGYNKKKHSIYSAPCARNQKKKAKKVNVPKTIKYGGKTYKVPKAKKSDYQKLLKGKGQADTAEIA